MCCAAAELGLQSAGNESQEGLSRKSPREDGGDGGGMRESTTGKNLKGHLIQSHHFLQYGYQMRIYI